MLSKPMFPQNLEIHQSVNPCCFVLLLYLMMVLLLKCTIYYKIFSCWWENYISICCTIFIVGLFVEYATIQLLLIYLEVKKVHRWQFITEHFYFYFYFSVVYYTRIQRFWFLININVVLFNSDFFCYRNVLNSFYPLFPMLLVR